MPALASIRHRSVVSPLRVFALILTLVFLVEMGIMLAIARVSPVLSDSPLMGLTDALVLTAILCPAVWWIVVRPLRQLVVERGLLLGRVFSAQEQERDRLAREIHDELGQQLTVVLLGLRAVEQSADVEQARSRVEAVRAAAAGTLESARRIARGLSPRVLSDFGLAVAIERLCEEVAPASGLTLERRVTLPEERLRPEVEIAAFRVVQEAVTNAVKHAGAGRLRIAVEMIGQELRLEVSDDGAGISPDREQGGGGPEGGFGLAGMRERVELLGGEFAVRSGHPPAGGTIIAASIPQAMAHADAKHA